MDKNGFLSLALIASFPRVRTLTDNIVLIKEALRSSEKVELSDDSENVSIKLLYFHKNEFELVFKNCISLRNFIGNF